MYGGETELMMRRWRRTKAIAVLTFVGIFVALFALTAPALAADPEGCLICHSDPDFTNPTPAEGEPTSLYVDSAKFEKSVHAKLACSSCHKGFVNTIPAHQQDPTKDYKEVAIEACETCHPDAFAAYQTSSHAKLFYQDQAAPICISCHGSHEIRKVRLGDETADFKMSMARDSCGRCHKDKFEKASHELHFKALSLGYARAATCFDCHGFHDNLSLKSGKNRLSNNAGSVTPERPPASPTSRCTLTPGSRMRSGGCASSICSSRPC